MRARFACRARRVLAQLPVSVLQRSTAQAPCLVVYHSVTDSAANHLRNLIPCRNVATFRQDLEFLLARFRPITLAQLTAWALHGEPLPPNAFHLTCDDGLRESVEVIALMCREKGVPATFFLTTEFLDNHHLGDRHLASLLLEQILALADQDLRTIMAKIESDWPDAVPSHRDWKDLLLARRSRHRDILDLTADLVGLDQQAWLRQVRPYAESQEIDRLLADGFSIGAHSLSHPFFPQISTDEQVRETVQSLQFLETRFHVNCSAFAFPFGADGVGPDYFAAVQKLRPETLFFGVGPASPVSGSRLMDRIALDADPNVPIETLLRRAYATRLEHRIRGIRPQVVHAPNSEAVTS